MMTKKNWGLVAPLITAAAVAAGVLMTSPRASVGKGVIWGLVIALAQSYASTATLQWAWNKKYFYWVWGGGMLFRMLVFAATAFVVYQYTQLSLVATMLTMVSATTFFLVVESSTFFSKPA